MDAGNTTWIIRLESGIPKVEISQIVDNVPVLECPSEREMVPQWDSGLYLSKEKGARINMIRCIYSLCLLNLIRDKDGNRIPDKKVFQAASIFFHTDFSRYSNDLTRSLADNTSMEKQTEIFRMMIDAFYERFDL